MDGNPYAAYNQAQGGLIMLAILTVLFTAFAAAAPSVAPLLASAPGWVHAILAGSAAAGGAVYHLYAPPPTSAKPT